ncbi:MAG: ATP-binding protein [Bacteroidales bacterium]|nr:ATP-binding protein [Bacteroidales bacterium]MDD3914695.1 ATP-binding protein [Bacteroidales bacterium]MDD4634555.1 ATP-binding protein [Bacteroidales bacterium]
MKDLSHNKNNNKWFSGKVLKIIQQHDLIKSGEKVCVGLSGGIDSTVLLFILEYIRRFSFLKFELSAIHAQVYAQNDTSELKKYCDFLEIEFFDISINKTNLPVPDKGICYTCSKLKKGAIIEFLTNKEIKKTAFGHHADDLTETLMMNLDYHHIVETLKPSTYLDKNDFTIIRPLLCLTKQEIIKLHSYFDLPTFHINCIYEEKNRREKYRNLVKNINADFPDFSKHTAEAFLKSFNV